MEKDPRLSAMGGGVGVKVLDITAGTPVKITSEDGLMILVEEV